MIKYISDSSDIDTIQDFNGQQGDRIIIDDKNMSFSQYVYFDASLGMLYKDNWFGGSRQNLAILNGISTSNPF